MDKPEIYISVDVETLGPCAGIHPMLSLGAAAFWEDGILESTFSANLLVPEFLKADPETENWWKTQPAAWAEVMSNRQDPDDVMPQFVSWVEGLPGKPAFVGYPVVFDWSFVNFYCHYYVGRNPFKWMGLDMQSFAMPLMGTTFAKTKQSNMPKEWIPKDLPYTHKALDDAKYQGVMFLRMLAVAKQRGNIG